MKESTFPISWTNVALEEVLTFVLGGDWGKDETFDDPDYVEVLCIRASELRNWDEEKGKTAALRKIKKSSLKNRELQEGDIIIEISGGGPDQPVGRTVLIDRSVLSKNPTYKKICTNFFRLIRPSSKLSSNYLNLYLQSFYKSGKISAYQAGSNNLRNLKFNNYTLIEVPLAPLNEQKRIVTKIEELFSELDNGIAALKTAREQLKVYRQAILKHAFEGKLTAKWRDENADKLESSEQLLARIQQERDARYQQQLQEWKTAVKTWKTEGKKPGKPEEPEQISSVLASDVQDLFKLPAGWLFLRLGNFIDKIDAGKSFKCDEREPTSAEVGVAKVSAVTWGEYNESESKTCLDKAKVNPDYYIKKNDFILSRANTIELVGACVIAQKVTKAIMLSDKTLRINFTGIDQKYVLQYLRSHYGRNEIMERSTGNQESMRNIGQDRIRSIVIPVCSSTEMDLINNAVNKQLESILLLSKEIDTQILKTETLRQSILKKAFSGKLVPQDPNDEPASELLARIKAMKEQQKQPDKKSRSCIVKKKVNQEA